MRPQPKPAEPGPMSAAPDRARDLALRYAEADTASFLSAMIRDEFPGRIALVSSFGAEAAVLLHLVSTIEPSTPVIFLDTGKLFGETLRYRDNTAARLGLTDIRTIRPDPRRVDTLDPDGVLWYGNPDMCCHIRKVEPLAVALDGFEATITGRKGFHGGERTGLQRIEADDDGRVKVNPLALWRKSDLEDYFGQHDLPRHPLEADGFLSIGCMPCTDRVAPGEHPRAGRWRGLEKTECGIHLPMAKWKVNGID
jgi:3''-phosphoadenosine 5''-phosphosulfate sulfotransferase (PAPS reductase)/FAD synthetase and related enzymes